MSLIIISDIHLGRYKYGRFNPETGLDLRTEDILNNIQQVIDFANENNVENIVITGDLYHLKRPLEIFRKALAQKIAKMLENENRNVYIMLGNHDQGKTAAHDLVELKEVGELLEGFHVIEEPNVLFPGDTNERYCFCFLPHINQIQLNIQNQDFFQYQVEKIKELAEIAKREKREGCPYTIFFGHFGTDKSKAGKSFDVGSSGKSARVIPLSIFDEHSWDRVYLGDIHKPQELNNFCRHVGSAAKVDFGEEDEIKGFWYFNEGKDQFIEFDDREFKTLDLDLTKNPREKMGKFCDDVQDLDLSKSIVRLRITINEQDRQLVKFKGLEDYLKDVSWNYIGKSITEIRNEEIEIKLEDNAELNYNQLFEEYLKEIKDQLDEQDIEEIKTKGNEILLEVLNK